MSVTAPSLAELTRRAYLPSAPRVARATGVAMVFQHLSLFEALNVGENVALGMENPPPLKELAAKIKYATSAIPSTGGEVLAIR